MSNRLHFSYSKRSGGVSSLKNSAVNSELIVDYLDLLELSDQSIVLIHKRPYN